MIPFFRRLFGRKYFIVEVEKGLKEDEILISGKKMYVLKNKQKWK